MYMYTKENDMSSESSFSDKCAINNCNIHTFCQGLVDLNLSTLWGWQNMFKTRYEN